MSETKPPGAHQHTTRIEMFDCVLDQMIDMNRKEYSEFDRKRRVAHHCLDLLSAEPELSRKELAGLVAVAADRLACK